MRRNKIDSESTLIAFCQPYVRKYRLNAERLEDLYNILREALYSSTEGTLSTRKAISLTLRFVGSAMDVV